MEIGDKVVQIKVFCTYKSQYIVTENKCWNLISNAYVFTNFRNIAIAN